MGKVISFDNGKSDVINFEVLRNNIVKLSPDMISPATEAVDDDTIVDHRADPIKSIDDINAISNYLVSNKKYRDNMLFIVGINFGLRESDLRVLRFSNLINDNLTFKTTFPVFEKKTRNTRKRKMNRYITINNAVIEAVTLYLANTPNVSLSDYMFKSESNNGSNINKPIQPKSIDRILKGWAEQLNLNFKMSSHTLRKTFCYHQMLMSGNSQRKLLLLQKMLNHSTPSQTLDYIGITYEEMQEAYLELNLGGKNCYSLLDSNIEETEENVSA